MFVLNNVNTTLYVYLERGQLVIYGWFYNIVYIVLILQCSVHYADITMLCTLCWSRYVAYSICNCSVMSIMLMLRYCVQNVDLAVLCTVCRACSLKLQRVELVVLYIVCWCCGSVYIILILQCCVQSVVLAVLCSVFILQCCIQYVDLFFYAVANEIFVHSKTITWHIKVNGEST